MRRLYAQILILSVSLVVSCQQGAKEPEQSVVNLSDIEVTTQIGRRKIYYRFPSPNDLISYIKSEQLVYSELFLNPTDNADRYLGSRLQLFNLGVFSADFAFITVFKNLSHAAKYFGAVEKIAYKNGLSPVFNESLRAKVQRNQNNMDSLSTIARDSYIEMVNHLTLSGREKQLAIISAGGYIEVLHLSVVQIDNTTDKQPILARVYDQRLGLENLIRFMNDYTSDDNWVLELQNDLKELLAAIRLGESEPTQTETKEVSAGEFAVTAQVKPVVYSAESYAKLKTTILKIRNKYTNPFLQER